MRAVQVGRHTLWQGDCLAILPRLEAGSVDVVVTSPPYNLDLGYNTYDDAKSEADYLVWMVDVARAVRRTMRPDASFFLNMSGSNSRPWLPFELIVRLRPFFVLQNHITWIKSVSTGQDSVGHFKPLGAQDARCRGNTWFIPYRTVQSRTAKYNHPGTFPIDLPRWCIRLHGRPGAVVLDPFAGTGTTLAAAALEGASGIGIELDAKYLATACERIA